MSLENKSILLAFEILVKTSVSGQQMLYWWGWISTKMYEWPASFAVKAVHNAKRQIVRAPSWNQRFKLAVRFFFWYLLCAVGESHR